MARWAGVKKGDRVELRGREYTVEKIKAKGKKVTVTVRGAGGVFTSKVKADDKVAIVKARDKRHDDAGWYVQTKAEKKADREDRERLAIPKGDAGQTAPPGKPGTETWDSRRDKLESTLGDVLGARLMGEAPDEREGYFVPPLDDTTIAAHLWTFHGVDPSTFDGYDKMHTLHERQHEAALEGVALHVNHWHTETRPAVSR